MYNTCGCAKNSLFCSKIEQQGVCELLESGNVDIFRPISWSCPSFPGLKMHDQCDDVACQTHEQPQEALVEVAFAAYHYEKWKAVFGNLFKKLRLLVNNRWHPIAMWRLVALGQRSYDFVPRQSSGVWSNMKMILRRSNAWWSCAFDYDPAEFSPQWAIGWDQHAAAEHQQNECENSGFNFAWTVSDGIYQDRLRMSLFEPVPVLEFRDATKFFYCKFNRQIQQNKVNS